MLWELVRLAPINIQNIPLKAMTETYIFSGTGKEVRLVSSFSDFCFVTESLDPAVPNPVLMQALPTQLKLKEGLASSPLSSPTSSPVPVAQAPSSLPSPQVETSITILNINNVSSATDLIPLVGIGKVYAKRIFGRKPEDGYSSWSHIAELNPDIQLNWDAIAKDNPGVIFS